MHFIWKLRSQSLEEVWRGTESMLLEVQCEVENLWNLNTRPNNVDDLKAAIKATWASITPEQCHRLIASMPRRIDAVIHAKGGPTKYWVHRNKHTFQKTDISVYNFLFFINLIQLLHIILNFGFSLSVSHNHKKLGTRLGKGNKGLKYFPMCNESIYGFHFLKWETKNIDLFHDILIQGSPTLLQESYHSEDFSSNLNQTHQNQLIKVFRATW